MANTVITQGVKMSELVASSQTVNSVALGDYVLLLTADGSNKMVKVSDLLKAINWNAAENELGVIANKPNVVTLEGTQTVKNKTFEACQEAPPSVVIFGPVGVGGVGTLQLSTLVAKSNSFVFDVRTSGDMFMPKASDVPMQTFSFLVKMAAASTFNGFQAVAQGGTVKWGDTPLELTLGKATQVVAFSDGIDWYMSQGKTF